ncbi:hypothetical protein BT67DRAFT_444195 [Trichocladium antarcticum]|uniref:Uncharacterized protein n=1 Tax=Trichocladium antarcticum TaxID=1450529 RepID=A0AAN6UFT4_9PEZI|nr:hypothetical protein BT67DRAFT_444195 [Trichocladium antarcticum]
MEPQPLDSLRGKRLMIQVYMWQSLNTTRSSLRFLQATAVALRIASHLEILNV